jgi:hypothetical protein
MKTFARLVSPVTILFIIPVLLLPEFFLLKSPYTETLGWRIGIYLSGVTVFEFVFGVGYILAGIYIHFMNKKKKGKKTSPRRLIVPGVWAVILGLIFFIGINFLLSLFGLIIPPDPLPTLTN